MPWKSASEAGQDLLFGVVLEPGTHERGLEADVDGGPEVRLRLLVADAVLVVEGGEDVVEVGLVEVRHAEAGGGGDVNEVVRGAVEDGRELFLEGSLVEDAAAADGILHRRMVDERLRGALEVALGVFGPVLAPEARAD